eukprot:4049795-Pyramimonas_sp.AAC.1
MVGCHGRRLLIRSALARLLMCVSERPPLCLDWRSFVCPFVQLVDGVHFRAVVGHGGDAAFCFPCVDQSPVLAILRLCAMLGSRAARDGFRKWRDDVHSETLEECVALTEK